VVIRRMRPGCCAQAAGRQETEDAAAAGVMNSRGRIEDLILRAKGHALLSIKTISRLKVGVRGAHGGFWRLELL
jgi:hypothetical protein